MTRYNVHSRSYGPWWGFMRVAAQSYLIVRPLGLLNIGEDLTRIEWVLSYSTNPQDVAGFVGRIREFELTRIFEDIGAEARSLQDNLSSRPASQQLTIAETQGIRNTVTRWRTIAQERVESMFLTAPETRLKPSDLMGGR